MRIDYALPSRVVREVTWNEITEVGVALDERNFATVEGRFVGAVFDFDANGALVADVGEDRKEAAPIDVTHAREFGRVILAGVSEDADFVEAVVVDADIFGVDVEEAVFE